MSRLKQESAEIIARNPWWEYKHDVFIDQNGKKGDYFYGETLGASIIVPILSDGRLILVQQHRYLRDRLSIEFPCGGIKKGEMPNSAALRELLEEAGGTASEIAHIATFDPLNGLFKEEVHLFIATNVVVAAEPQNDSIETTEVLYRRVDEFEDMIRRGEIWDGETLAAWALTREHVMAHLDSYEKETVND